MISYRVNGLPCLILPNDWQIAAQLRLACPHQVILLRNLLDNVQRERCKLQNAAHIRPVDAVGGRQVPRAHCTRAIPVAPASDKAW